MHKRDAAASGSTSAWRAAGRGSIPRPGTLGLKTWLSIGHYRLCISMSFGGDTKSRWSLLSGVYVRGSEISHQSALDMCNLSWTPHYIAYRRTTLSTTPVLAQRWVLDYIYGV